MSAAMITRWHYYISVEMVTGWAQWIVNVSSCIARRKHQHIHHAGKKHELVKWDGVPCITTEREERQMDRKRQEGCSAL